MGNGTTCVRYLGGVTSYCYDSAAAAAAASQVVKLLCLDDRRLALSAVFTSRFFPIRH